MKPNSQEHGIRLAGGVLRRSRHVCAFFHHKEEEYSALMDFVRDGFERGEKAFHIVDSRERDAHRTRLTHEGIAVTDAETKGQLRVACWEDAYLKDGYFDQDRQLTLIQNILDLGRKEGFPLTRLVANMEWALEDKAGVEDIVEYEAKLNYVLPKYDDPVICTYDLSRFNAGVALDILRTHPVVILDGVLQENPLYVDPDEFLKDLSTRRLRPVV
ncbi:MAG: MEDS domain-containing protein [Verrucomicrobiota bacterium]